MNDQPEAAAKAAEHINRRAQDEENLLTDGELARIIGEHFAPIIARRDEQLAALTDKLASVRTERDTAITSRDVVKHAWNHCQTERDAHVATIEGLKVKEGIARNSADVNLADMLFYREQADALRTRVAELERERDETKKTLDDYADYRDTCEDRIERLKSELAQARREKEEALKAIRTQAFLLAELKDAATQNTTT